ncbi:MAG TPA: VCBS repeat-containing protein, partial [Isosphaeraceae bacterium]|nr:VCBS repeat-containing protein [Isosphaeraceae bacterium]
IAGQVRELSRIYVDAVSGRNGQKLWHWRTDLNHGDTTPVGSPFWWGRRPDGWPLLALPIGGTKAPERFAKNPYFTPDPPVVHLLAAATGREAHVVEGLSRPGTADLDGDGLADLWGAVDGKVRAFRALAPEAWRALGGFQPAGDLDGDGVSDVVSNDLKAPQVGRDPKPDSGTAIARSGRDGRILWQALLDPWENRFFWGDWAVSYGVEPLKVPAGDLDGDGAPDIVVHRSTSWTHNNQRRAGIRLQALSGRTGRTLWPAGALPYVDSNIGIPYVAGIDAAACKGWGRSDVFVLHHNFVKQSSIPPFTFSVQSRLARLSSRDGRLIWDVLLAEYKGGMKSRRDFVYEFADLDGDGSLEMVLLFNGKAPAGTVPFEVRVLSLATGDTRWSHPLNPRAVGSPTCVVGDLDGDKRPEVVVSEQPIVQGLPLTEVTALDGETGTPRWVWRGSAGRDVTYQDVALVLADFDGRGRREVCVSFGVAPECRRVEILDSQGRSRGARDTESVNLAELINVDLDGDGRDELLFRDAGRLCAVRGDLTEIWSWPTREPIREVLP